MAQFHLPVTWEENSEERAVRKQSLSNRVLQTYLAGNSNTTIPPLTVTWEENSEGLAVNKAVPL